MRARVGLARLLGPLVVAGALTVPTQALPAAGAAGGLDCAAVAVADAGQAALVAESCDKQVEVLAARSEYSQVFANPDGTSTFETSAVPARVRRADGSWAAVDTTLQPRPDGSLGPVAALADVSFSPGGSGPFVTYRRDGSALTLSWPTPLAAPAVAGDTVTYPNVLPGVDLRATATATGFRHVLVVRTAQAAANPALARIRYQVGGDVKALPTPDGRVRFAGVAGGTVAMTAAASMWDSAVDPGVTGEIAPGVDIGAIRTALIANPPPELVSTVYGPGATAEAAAVGVSTDASDGLVLTPDPKVLDSPALPVYIDPAIGPTRTKWAYANSINSNWDVTGQAWIGPNPYDGTRYRSFLDFPTSSSGHTYKGKHVLSASVSIKLDHSWSCSDTWAHLFRTSAITVGNGARMGWGTRPLGSGAKWLDSAEGHANEAGGCGSVQPDMLMTFGGNSTMRADVQAAATANQNTYTVGLCACNADGEYESTQSRWKRFHINSSTTMSVTYNTVPGTPAELSPHQGQVACGGVVGTYSPKLQARYVDADGSDTLSATFAWQQLPSGPTTSVAGTSKPANNNGTATLSLGSGAEGRSYRFQVRTHDGHDYSPWSAWCQFTVDTIAPPAPTVTSVASGTAAVYPACDPAAISSCAATGGPGVAGAFTFSTPPGGADVVTYVYGWDTPSVAVTVAPGASFGPVPLTPPRYGINTLAVHSVDGSGKQSPTTRYTFLVDGPSAAVAHWPLDSMDGHGFADQIGAADLVATGDVAWTPDVRYLGADAASFDADPGDGQTGHLATAGPVLDTTRSFSVAAWVRLDNLTSHRTAVSQDGSSRSRFMLYYTPDSAAWAFAMYTQDGPSTDGAFATGGTPVAGKWTHLTGVYDAAAAKISLYVDGVLVSARTHTPVWAATGALAVGRGLADGTARQPWRGQIADVRAWNRVVVPDDIWGTDADPTTGVPAQPGFVSPLQVGSWQFPDGECFCPDSPDDSRFARRLFLSPNWALDPSWSGDPETTPAWLTADSHDGTGGLRLDGGSGYASTTDDNGTLGTGDDVAHPVLRTDQSLTVAAWVRLDSGGTADQVVLRQGLGSASAVKLHYKGSTGGWTFSVSTPDGTGGYDWVGANSDTPAAVGTWVHLVGTFDATVGRVRLHVDGQPQAATMAGGAGWHSTGSLVVGGLGTGGSELGGTVDQIQAWQGVLSAREIQNLYRTT